MKTLAMATTLCAVMAVSGCSKGGQSNRTVVDGRSYRASLSVDKSDPAFVMAEAAIKDGSVEGPREAARHRAVSHCIANFGSSEIIWEHSPDAETPHVVNGTLIIKGRCLGW